jgi:hypothetical protein
MWKIVIRVPRSWTKKGSATTAGTVASLAEAAKPETMLAARKELKLVAL